MDETNEQTGIAPNPIHPANPEPKPFTPPLSSMQSPEPAKPEPPKPSFMTPDPIKPAPFGKLDAKTEPKAPVEDPPDTKEQHFEAIRYLIDQLKATTDAPTKAALENICTRLDEIEDKKPEKTVKW